MPGVFWTDFLSPTFFEPLTFKLKSWISRMIFSDWAHFTYFTHIINDSQLLYDVIKESRHDFQEILKNERNKKGTFFVNSSVIFYMHNKPCNYSSWKFRVFTRIAMMRTFRAHSIPHSRNHIQLLLFLSQHACLCWANSFLYTHLTKQ